MTNLVFQWLLLLLLDHLSGISFVFALYDASDDSFPNSKKDVMIGLTCEAGLCSHVSGILLARKEEKNG